MMWFGVTVKLRAVQVMTNISSGIRMHLVLSATYQQYFPSFIIEPHPSTPGCLPPPAFPWERRGCVTCQRGPGSRNSLLLVLTGDNTPLMRSKSLLAALTPGCTVRVREERNWWGRTVGNCPGFISYILLESCCLKMLYIPEINAKSALFSNWWRMFEFELVFNEQPKK